MEGPMVEKMPLSAPQPGRRPPAFRSPGAQVRKQLSGPVGGAGKPSRLSARLPEEPCLSVSGPEGGQRHSGW